MSLVDDRPGTYDADKCWDTSTEDWVAINTLDINELGGAQYRQQIIIIGEQGHIYIGDI